MRALNEIYTLPLVALKNRISLNESNRRKKLSFDLMQERKEGLLIEMLTATGSSVKGAQWKRGIFIKILDTHWRLGASARLSPKGGKLRLFLGNRVDQNARRASSSEDRSDNNESGWRRAMAPTPGSFPFLLLPAARGARSKAASLIATSRETLAVN